MVIFWLPRVSLVSLRKSGFTTALCFSIYDIFSSRKVQVQKHPTPGSVKKDLGHPRVVIDQFLAVIDHYHLVTDHYHLVTDQCHQGPDLLALSLRRIDLR